MKRPTPALVFLVLFEFTLAYRPVVVIHGIWDLKTSLDTMADRIREVY